MSEIGDRLRELRVRKGMTQRLMALELGMAPAQLSNIETGRKVPRVATLKRFAFVFGVTLAELVDPENAARRKPNRAGTRN